MMRLTTLFFMSLTTSPLVFCSPDTAVGGSSAGGGDPLPQATTKSKPTVLLLHGMCRSRRAMAPLARHFKNAGYQVLRPTYPSRKMDLQGLTADWLTPYLESHKEQLGDNWCVVSHSLGGIIMREWLAGQPTFPQPRTVVMLAPPNQGSELTDLLGGIGLYRWINGPVGSELGTQPEHRVMQLPDWPEQIPLCILAGNRTVNPLYFALPTRRGKWIYRD